MVKQYSKLQRFSFACDVEMDLVNDEQACYNLLNCNANVWYHTATVFFFFESYLLYCRLSDLLVLMIAKPFCRDGLKASASI